MMDYEDDDYTQSVVHRLETELGRQLNAVELWVAIHASALIQDDLY
jgi:hypothetical protein